LVREVRPLGERRVPRPPRLLRVKIVSSRISFSIESSIGLSGLGAAAAGVREEEEADVSFALEVGLEVGGVEGGCWAGGRGVTAAVWTAAGAVGDSSD